ncbi:Patatin-like phospholipase [Caballeronia terrestris]|uniref:Patatin-like phospholipase n=1 Tax=Caballeronia terrestris TaxID=1226301 RepID=A0A158JWZ9_9BURK|nr:patatin-like phospholipase family protein [Caballeronia terrestris]SAL72770.1 Patatin-like phospholipase [Caballeronia terrestris]
MNEEQSSRCTDSMMVEKAHARREHFSDLPKDTDSGLWGIALSGGGIRSATFCAGLLKALAQNRVFHRFDVMSTVSGGGYIGGTVGKLFDNARETGQHPIEIEQALADADSRRFAVWLRANGRYLIPNGTKDILYASANFIRSLLGVHVELAILSILLGGVLVGLDLAIWAWADCITSNGGCWAPLGIGKGALAVLSLWPTIWIVLPIPAWFGCMFAFAYWATPEKAGQRIDVQHMLIALVSAASIAAIAYFGNFDRIEGVVEFGRLELPMPWVLIADAILGAAVVGIVLASILRRRKPDVPDALRNALTTCLANVLRIVLVILALGVIDGLAWWFAKGDTANTGIVGGAIATTVIALRVLLPRISDLPQNLAPLSRRRLLALVNLAGIAVLALIVVFWISLLHRTATAALFSRPPAPLDFELGALWLALMVAAPLVVVLVSFHSLDSLNRSSLYSFYRARLVRSFLGAANPKRFDPNSNDATVDTPFDSSPDGPMSRIDDVHPLDDVSISDYSPHEAGGPIHLLNVCINQTHDPRGGLFNQDRKGMLMTVGPNGLIRVGQRGWARIDPKGAPSLGSWMAISGAAVAPGLGGNTRPGIAALSMIAGLRLGYWCDSDALVQTQADSAPVSKHRGGASKYEQLLSELVGRFNGDESRYWYLSDGGHIENTGAYALLRERCSLIVVADCGADPRYGFRDLENLVRKARIDLQAEVTFLRPKPGDAHAICGFGSLDELASEESTACLALAQVTYKGTPKIAHMIVVKPNMCANMPVDLVNFKGDNPLFPQEPTTDQFFSEAQWESYFRLGQTLGRHLTAGLLDDLPQFVDQNFVKDEASASGSADAATEANRLPVQTRRIPARIAAASAVTASFSIGAIATLGFSTWQAVKAELQARDSSTHIQPASFRELTDIFGKIAPTNTTQLALNDARIGEMASALLRIGEVECTDLNSQAFRNSPLILLMVSSTRDACRRATQRHPACDALASDDKLPACLQTEPRAVCEQQYWIRSYGDGTNASNNSVNCPNHAIWKTAASTTAPPVIGSDVPAAPNPQTSPPPPQSASDPYASEAQGASSTVATGATQPPPPATAAQPLACKGRTVYLQIYGPELRDRVRSLREPWRALGASVPPVEDVWDTARRSGRKAPQPYTVPTVIYHDPDSKPCADQLAPKDAAPQWSVVPLSARLEGRPGTIEVWIPPLQANVGGPPDSAYCYQEDVRKDGPGRYGVHCHTTRSACESARGPNATRQQSACVATDLSAAEGIRYLRGWAGSWYALAAQPFKSPFPPLE